jgi:hypothetical protein
MDTPCLVPLKITEAVQKEASYILSKANPQKQNIHKAE